MHKGARTLINALIDHGVLKTPRIIDAFKTIDRQVFVLPEYEDRAYLDQPLSIGHGQTISQPHTVAFMLELLEAKEGDRVLDVGSGSGWSTALLAHIIGSEGRVWGVEIVPALIEQGQDNISKYNLKNAEIMPVEDTLGLPELAPFDRILVSAAAHEVPKELIDQLKIGGVMVIPVEHAILRVTRISDTEIDTERYEGFAFVPLLY